MHMVQLCKGPKQTVLLRSQLMFAPLLAVCAPHEINLGEPSRKEAEVLGTLFPLEEPPTRSRVPPSVPGSLSDRQNQTTEISCWLGS